MTYRLFFLIQIMQSAVANAPMKITQPSTTTPTSNVDRRKRCDLDCKPRSLTPLAISRTRCSGGKSWSISGILLFKTLETRQISVKFTVKTVLILTLLNRRFTCFSIHIDHLHCRVCLITQN